MTSFCNCELCMEIKRNIEKRKQNTTLPNKRKIIEFINTKTGYKYGIGDKIEHEDKRGLFLILKVFPTGDVFVRKIGTEKETCVLSKDGIGKRHYPKYYQEKVVI